MSDNEMVRVLRVIEYTGPRAWVEEVTKLSIHGEKVVKRRDTGEALVIRAATIGEYPEIIAPEPPKPQRSYVSTARLILSQLIDDLDAGGSANQLGLAQQALRVLTRETSEQEAK